MIVLLAMTHSQFHAEEFFAKGIEHIKAGNVAPAIDAFFDAAVSSERAQDFRRIAALWEAIGKMLDPSFRREHAEWLQQFQKDGDEALEDRWYQWPLEHHTISRGGWRDEKDPLHKQAWAYQWAAEHRESWGGTRSCDVARYLFLRAARCAEQTHAGKVGLDWPIKLYRNAVLNHIKSRGSVDDREIQQAIQRIKALSLAMPDKQAAYGSLASDYRLIKAALGERGNLSEAERLRGEERSALAHYYFHKGNVLRLIGVWLSGSGFRYILITFLLLAAFVFPAAYLFFDAITVPEGVVTATDAVTYSLETALSVDHYLVGQSGAIGTWLAIAEAFTSFLGLGAFIWWVTRRLE